LPNKFNFKYGKLDCVIHYDNVSQEEQEQIKLDIQNAYEAYKAKFCIAGTQGTVHTYIFNNENDYKKYGTKVPGFSKYQDMVDKSAGMTDGRSVSLYKNAYMDNVLAHELGHVFQFRFSMVEVEALDRVNSQLMANAIGLEVEEKNYKAICEQKDINEYKKFNDKIFEFEYKGTLYQVWSKARQNLSGEEKVQFIKDIKSSHESLTSECYRLGGESATLKVHIYVGENKDIDKVFFYNPDKNLSKWLDKTLINRGKPEEEVNEVEHTGSKEEQSNVEESQQGTQQPSDSSPNVIFQALDYIIGSISSFFSWLFGSKEKEQPAQQSDGSLSLFEFDASELDHDVGDHVSNNHYHSSDELI
jgi:hypothetical protein